jgi:hypothetical protein
VPAVAASARYALGGSVASGVGHWQAWVIWKASGGMVGVAIKIDAFEKLSLLYRRFCSCWCASVSVFISITNKRTRAIAIFDCGVFRFLCHLMFSWFRLRLRHLAFGIWHLAFGIWHLAGEHLGYCLATRSVACKADRVFNTFKAHIVNTYAQLPCVFKGYVFLGSLLLMLIYQHQTPILRFFGGKLSNL